jgi:hypothetical protein
VRNESYIKSRFCRGAAYSEEVLRRTKAQFLESIHSDFNNSLFQLVFFKTQQQPVSVSLFQDSTTACFTQSFSRLSAIFITTWPTNVATAAEAVATAAEAETTAAEEADTVEGALTAATGPETTTGTWDHGIKVVEEAAGGATVATHQTAGAQAATTTTA